VRMNRGNPSTVGIRSVVAAERPGFDSRVNVLDVVPTSASDDTQPKSDKRGRIRSAHSSSVYVLVIVPPPSGQGDYVSL